MDVARRSAWVVAAFAAALDFAAVVCAYGFVSLLTDVEVIASPHRKAPVRPAAQTRKIASTQLVPRRLVAAARAQQQGERGLHVPIG